MWGGSRKICDFHIACKLFLYCIVDTTHILFDAKTHHNPPNINFISKMQ